MIVPQNDLQRLSLQRVELDDERKSEALALVRAACTAEPGKGAHVDVYA